MTVDRNRLYRLASLQNAVFTRSQALSAGVSPTALKCDADAGRVKRVLPNAYIIAGAPNSWEQSVLAAVRSAEQPAVASHHTAAYLWGLVSKRPAVIEISMHRWLRAIRDYRVHESTDLVPDDCTELRHIPITTPARTVVDLGATDRGLVAEALDAGLRLGRFQLEDVARVVGRVARRGRRGVGTVKPLLAVRLDWEGRSEGEAEDLFRRVLDRGSVRLPQPVAQYEIRNESGELICRADFAYVEVLCRIEIDGDLHRVDRETFRRDRRQQNATELLGWRTLRYTWWDLVVNPHRVRSEIAAILGVSIPAADR
jgi:hypothetical protein